MNDFETSFLILFVLGVFGIWEITRRRPEAGAYITVLLLLCTVGLVLYMNFADGTRFDPNTGDAYQEVRDRDYFWTPAFVVFGLAIGMGAGALMELIRKFTEKFGQSQRRLALMASFVLVLTPFIPASANYFGCDRSKNYLAYDFAYNLLSSCDKDAILFTAGWRRVTLSIFPLPTTRVSCLSR